MTVVALAFAVGCVTVLVAARRHRRARDVAGCDRHAWYRDALARAAQPREDTR